jgi:hypothetical protein
LAAEIVDPVASRVFARSSFEYGHDMEALAAEAAVFMVTVLQPAAAAAAPVPVPVLFSVPPQAVTSNAAATTRAAASTMRPYVRVFISVTS